MREGADPAIAARSSSDTPYFVIGLIGLARRRLRLILGTAALGAALGFAFAMLQPPVYRATVDLLVDPQALQIVGHDIVRPDTGGSIDLASVDSQALVITSTAVLRDVVDQLHLADDKVFMSPRGLLARLFGTAAPAGTTADAIDVLKAALVVQRVDTSLVFQITASDPRAQRSAEIANAVASSYLREVAQERVDAVGRATASVLGQVATLRGQLDHAEAAAERYRATHGLLRNDTGLIVTQQLKDLYTQIDAANAEMTRLAARRDALARIGPEALLTDVVPEALSSPTVVALRAQYAATARDLASLSQTLLDQHPRVQEVRAELAETRKLLRDELARIRGSATSAYDQSAANVAKLQARAATLRQDKVDSSEAEIGLRQLESETDAERSVFNATLDRARELQQQGKITTSNSHVLSDAMPPAKPSKSPLPVVVAAAALFGGCVGLGLAFLLDLRRSPSRPARGRLTAREAADLVGAKIAAPVARVGPDQRWVGRGDPPADLHAVGRELQRLFGPGVPALVAVVSLGPGARARETCDALGDALADLGDEVLVCDPRKGLADMEVRRIAPRAPRASAESLVAAAHRTGRLGAQAAPSPSAQRTEFILSAWESADAGAFPAAIAEAIVLIVDLDRVDVASLREATRSIDPSGRKIAVLLDVSGGAPARMPDPMREAA